MANYVVGDIQGCVEPLQRLLAKVGFAAGRDTLWSVGDMVNRGPHSLETLRLLYQLRSAFTAVLGNHDLHFLAVKSGAKADGKTKKLRTLLDAPDSQQLAEWLQQMPLAYQQRVTTDAGERQVLMVHAGIVPGWDSAKTLELAAEVATALRGRDHLSHRLMRIGIQRKYAAITLWAASGVYGLLAYAIYQSKNSIFAYIAGAGWVALFVFFLRIPSEDK